MIYEPLPYNRCSQCGEIKPWSRRYFHWNKQRGIHKPCRECRKAEHRRARINNPERVKAAERRYRETHIDAIQQRGAHYRANNSNKVKERHRKYKRENAEKVAHYNHQYYESHRDQYRDWNIQNHEKNKRRYAEKARIYRETHREASRQRACKRRQLYPDKHRVYKQRYRARKFNLPDTFTTQDWHDCLTYWGNTCAICGRTKGFWHTLAADHWIPLNATNCPGTVPTNILPLCHGQEGCNNSKCAHDPIKWLATQYKPKQVRKILARIARYFEWVEQRKEMKIQLTITPIP